MGVCAWLASDPCPPRPRPPAACRQVMSDPGGGMTFVQDPKKPLGGHVVAHASTTRLSLRKGKGEQRVIKVVDSPCLPEVGARQPLGRRGVGRAG